EPSVGAGISESRGGRIAGTEALNAESEIVCSCDGEPFRCRAARCIRQAAQSQCVFRSRKRIRSLRSRALSERRIPRRISRSVYCAHGGEKDPHVPFGGCVRS